MDRLKDINDSFGHEAGNSAIILVAQCLQRSIRGTDTAARFGGDEFAVLLPGASPEIAEAVVKRVRHNVYKTTLDLRSRMIRCSVSIGVVNYPQGRPRHARIAEHRRSQDVSRQRIAARSRRRGQCVRYGVGLAGAGGPGGASSNPVWTLAGMMAKLALHHVDAWIYICLPCTT